MNNYWELCTTSANSVNFTCVDYFILVPAIKGTKAFLFDFYFKKLITQIFFTITSHGDYA